MKEVLVPMENRGCSTRLRRMSLFFNEGEKTTDEQRGIGGGQKGLRRGRGRFVYVASFERTAEKASEQASKQASEVSTVDGAVRHVPHLNSILLVSYPRVAKPAAAETMHSMRLFGQPASRSVGRRKISTFHRRRRHGAVLLVGNFSEPWSRDPDAPLATAMASACVGLLMVEILSLFGRLHWPSVPSPGKPCYPSPKCDGI